MERRGRHGPADPETAGCLWQARRRFGCSMRLRRLEAHSAIKVCKASMKAETVCLRVCSDRADSRDLPGRQCLGGSLSQHEGGFLGAVGTVGQRTVRNVES